MHRLEVEVEAGMNHDVVYVPVFGNTCGDMAYTDADSCAELEQQGGAHTRPSLASVQMTGNSHQSDCQARGVPK